jgi:hypothetical protein
MTAMLERTGYNNPSDRVRESPIKLGTKRGRYDEGATSWNNRVRAMITYVINEISRRHTALDRE